MYWFVPTIFTTLLIALGLAIAALTTSYSYPITIALVVVVAVSVGLGLVELAMPKAKARGFRMPTGGTPLYAPTDVPRLTTNIAWPKNLG